MRVFPFFIALVCVVVGTVLGYELWSKRSPSRPQPRPEASGPEAGTRSTEESKPRSEASDRTAPDTPSVTSVTRKSDTVEIGRISRSLGRWTMNRADRDYLAGFSHEKQARLLLAEWDIKNAIRTRTSKQHRPVPERIHRVSLDNGKLLWARDTRKVGGKVEITMLNDIRVSFPEYDVQKDEELPGHVYLKETQRQYESDVLDLNDTPKQLLRGVGMALAREDMSRVQRFYQRWLAAGGAQVLARDLASLESERVLAGARILGFETPKAVASFTSSKSGADANESRESLVPLPAPPDDEDELRRRMSGFNAHLKKRLSSGKRQRLLEELLVCERWLEETGSKFISDPNRLKKYQQDIQFLRLDLLKAGGF